MTKEQQQFITFVRTQQFIKLRFRGKDPMQHVFISQKEIGKRFFPHPKFDLKTELHKLVEKKELEIEERILENGHHAHFYKALTAGNVDLTLLEPRGKKLNKIHMQMISFLQFVSFPKDTSSSIYFEAFLFYKEAIPKLFFTVDEFSNRIHTPITSLRKECRKKLLLKEENTISLDVATMQPLLLGKILEKGIGNNEFSNWMNNGKDIYLLLQKKAKLGSRDEAKKKFFQILYAPANKQLTSIFGLSNWINWINEFKQKPFTSNPHTTEKKHSNLAWLLQSEEVKLMFKVWYNLIQNNIPFLSVHDEIIIRKSDYQQAKIIFQAVLKSNFVYFKLNSSINHKVRIKKNIN